MPPQITCASTLPGKWGNTKILHFHSNDAVGPISVLPEFNQLLDLFTLFDSQLTLALLYIHPLPSNRHHRRCGDCLEGKGEKLSGLFCAILCATIVHSAMHTHMNRLTVLWIGFCLTGPISLCLD